ncbi:acyl-CoA dehydrogenase NM domain-like protein [Microthyrium microscopicum]|uniref:Acyl-CoA dehydrogenase NM domain-like protein n=1 Tax=Microthyrium microscopicum TaxID=703497 RepID=A0A6A6UR55_9PEZI|nr:acyl-CoA dehydrogenase NM domain-like protein [Microthyrium microscopicum]
MSIYRWALSGFLRRGSCLLQSNVTAASRHTTNLYTRRRCFSSSPSRSLMDTSNFTSTQLEVREAVSKLCSQFPDEYWMERDRKEQYPHELHAAMVRDGWIGIALPEELGGGGLGISEATMLLNTISQSGAGMAGAQSIHANVYATQPLAKFGTDQQNRDWIPDIIQGRSRTCFGVTEPNSGLNTLALTTTATRSGDNYLISGQKIWISSAQVATHMILLARTTPVSESPKPTHGLSLFYIPFKPDNTTLTLTRIPKLGARAIDANQVFFDSYIVPADSLIGTLDAGFSYVLHGMNAERCLLAGEALGLGYAALKKATKYARERSVFGAPIGSRQGIQHPLAKAWMGLEAAKLATYHAAKLYDEGVDAKVVGTAANTAKYLAAEAAFEACERAVLTLGGMGYSEEFHVERYLRECFIPRIAPVSREMIMNYVGERVLGLPRSY